MKDTIDIVVTVTVKAVSTRYHAETMAESVSPGHSGGIRYHRRKHIGVVHLQEKRLLPSWWEELRVLLKYKQVTRPLFLQWAEIFARMSRSTRRVPTAVIRRRMERWKFDLTVNDILNYTPHETPNTPVTTEGQLTEKSHYEAFGLSGTGTVGKTTNRQGVGCGKEKDLTISCFERT